jgi:putative endonuclease
MKRKEIGQLGEDIAVGYLKKRSYRIKEKNYWTAQGEIDIIAEKDNRLIFLEVKTLSENNCFQPEDHLNLKKKKQLIKLSRAYLRANNYGEETSWQIDIIAVQLKNRERCNVKHYLNAVADSC